jgi:hypothetical protein
VPAVPDHVAIRVRLSPLVISGVGAGSAWANPQ